MRIIFNLHNVGLGNNGGSRTLVKCAETLSKMGNDVVLHSNQKSRYRWHSIDKGVTMSLSGKIPNGDVVVATGYGSVKSTVKSNIKKKFYYIRGFELWNAKRKNLLSSYRSLNCIVNSSWLMEYLKENNIHSDVVYSGLDFDTYYNKNEDRDDIIGGLFSKRHKTKRHSHVINISNLCNKKLLMLGKDCRNRPFSEINDFYNKIKVWVSTSELEGFHNPPTEASMCGCALVCTDHLRSGAGDYAINNETALMYSPGDMEFASNNVNLLLSDDKLRLRLIENMNKLLLSKIGNRKKNMKIFMDIIS
jgi:hypothetical protein